MALQDQFLAQLTHHNFENATSDQTTLALANTLQKIVDENYNPKELLSLIADLLDLTVQEMETKDIFDRSQEKNPPLGFNDAFDKALGLNALSVKREIGPHSEELRNNIDGMLGIMEMPGYQRDMVMGISSSLRSTEAKLKKVTNLTR